MNKNDRDFLKYAYAECKKNGVKIIFSKSKYVLLNGCNCSGFFDETNKQIRVGTKKPFKNYFPIFIHEFCHFTQWLDKEPSYVNVLDTKGNMWDWLDGKDIPVRELKKSIRKFQMMELDCERRVIQMIEDFNLSIDKYWYIKTSNAYVLYYDVIRETREWYDTPPYHFEEIMKNVPIKLIKKFKPTKKFRRLVNELCYNEV